MSFLKQAVNKVKNLLLVSLPSLLLCFASAECVFRWVIPAAQMPEGKCDVKEGLWHFDTRGPRDGINTIGRLASIRARWHINNFGWNSDIDYNQARRPSMPRVAIVGDSYVEAFQVDADRNLSAVLSRKFDGKAEIYSMGMSGAPLSHYLQMSRYARRHFSPDVLVIVVVHNDFDESVATLFRKIDLLQVRPSGNTYEEIQPAPYENKKWKRAIRRTVFHSAFIRYLYWNLQVVNLYDKLASRTKPPEFNANIAVSEVIKNKDIIGGAVAYIVKRIRSENPDTRIVFLMDGLRGDIYKGGLESNSLLWMGQLLKMESDENQCEFIDMNPIFEAHWKANHQKFEFSIDGHWNELGHRVAAEALYKKLMESGDITKPLAAGLTVE